MKTIIKRRADQLQPGDIIQRGVSVIVTWVGAEVIYTVTFGITPRLGLIEYNPSTLFDVEVDQLTPAQQHADELAEVLRDIRTLPVGARVDLARRADELLAKINPPVLAPTLQEALDALIKLADGAGAVIVGTHFGHSMQPARSAANAIISRARATGVLK